MVGLDPEAACSTGLEASLEAPSVALGVSEPDAGDVGEDAQAPAGGDAAGAVVGDVDGEGQLVGAVDAAAVDPGTAGAEVRGAGAVVGGGTAGAEDRGGGGVVVPAGVVFSARTESGENVGRPSVPSMFVPPKIHRSTLPGSGL